MKQTYDQFNAETRGLTVNVYTGKDTGSAFVITKLEVIVSQTTVEIDNIGAYVNGQHRTGAYIDDVVYVKQATGSFYLIRLFGVVIIYDKTGTSLHIHVSPYYADKVSGLQRSITWLLANKVDIHYTIHV